MFRRVQLLMSLRSELESGIKVLPMRKVRVEGTALAPSKVPALSGSKRPCTNIPWLESQESWASSAGDPFARVCVGAGS